MCFLAPAFFTVPALPRPSHGCVCPKRFPTHPSLLRHYEGVDRHFPRPKFLTFPRSSLSSPCCCGGHCSLPPPSHRPPPSFSPSVLVYSRLTCSPTGGISVPCHLLRAPSRGISPQGVERLFLLSYFIFSHFSGSCGDLLGALSPCIRPPVPAPQLYLWLPPTDCRGKDRSPVSGQSRTGKGGAAFFSLSEGLSTKLGP